MMDMKQNLRWVSGMLPAILVLALMPAGMARPMKTWTPAELLERADLVVAGKALNVKPTGEEGVIQLGKSNPKTPVKFLRATVEVIAVVKGKKIADEIEVDFSPVDFEKLGGQAIVNGAMRLRLAEDQLYLLYLKKRKDGRYVGVLDGDFDDYAAAVLLSKKPEKPRAVGEITRR